MLTRQQISAMPFRFKYLGNYVSFKQRYTRELSERIWNDPALNPYKRDIMFFLNSERTHGIIAGVTNVGFVQVLMRVKNKHAGYMLMHQGQQMIAANSDEVVRPEPQLHTDPDEDELPF